MTVIKVQEFVHSERLLMHKTEILKDLKYRAGNQLYPILEQSKNPAIVTIDEDIELDYDPVRGLDRLTIRIEVKEIGFRTQVYTSPDFVYTTHLLPKKPKTFWGRLKYLLGK